MERVTRFMMSHKKTYLMIGGTLLPAAGFYMAAKALKANEGTKNIAFVVGLIVGGMLTSKMLK